MQRSKQHSLLFLAWWCLVALALRPVPVVQDAFDTLLTPLRLLGELTQPIRWLRAGEVRAAEDSLASTAQREYAERLELEAALVAGALPTAPELRSGRRLVPAEVVARTRGDLDQLVVRLPAGAEVRAGNAVVAGDAFVGRVERLLVGDRAEVRLLTSRGFFVGAAVPLADGSRVQLTVGELDRAPGEDRLRDAPEYLAVHAPEDREVGLHAALAGDVVVAPLFRDLEPAAVLAEGYRLGRLVRRGHWIGVEPTVDFAAGLFQVTVLAGDEPRALGGDTLTSGAGVVAEAPRDILADDHWLAARPLSHGDPNPNRAGLVVSRGRLAGVAPGAALVHGARLLGRVLRTRPLSSDVALLADPAFQMVALARLEPEGAEPLLFPLGRLVSTGEDAAGRVRFRWRAVVQLDGEALELSASSTPGQRASVPATLFSGSGERGLPRGLYVGRTQIPVGPAPRGGHLLVLEPEHTALDLATLWLRGGASAAERADDEGGTP